MMVVMSLFSKMAWLLVTGLNAWLQTLILPSNTAGPLSGNLRLCYPPV